MFNFAFYARQNQTSLRLLLVKHGANRKDLLLEALSFEFTLFCHLILSRFKEVILGQPLCLKHLLSEFFNFLFLLLVQINEENKGYADALPWVVVVVFVDNMFELPSVLKVGQHICLEPLDLKASFCYFLCLLRSFLSHLLKLILECLSFAFNLAHQLLDLLQILVLFEQFGVDCERNFARLFQRILI